ncbi:MAG: 50S ribosomal protein L10 [Puniceicoccales bacterium]|jgi:large subunit ribosomal protein L10|nr:50S ribosomal protein L10 [Puniceicoccales bacterium]
MREEKKYLVDEAAEHLRKSDYVFVAGFDRLTVADVADLRKLLREKEAEYHVVKNSVLDLAVKRNNLPRIVEDALRGATAIVTGGGDPSGVAKVLEAFSNEKGRENKINLKFGILAGKSLTAKDVIVLSKLPSLRELRAQFLATLQAPAQNFLSVLQGSMRGLAQVLRAQSEKDKTM